MLHTVAHSRKTVLNRNRITPLDCCTVSPKVAGERTELWGLIGGLEYAQGVKDGL
jgi:hypothetical protein